MLLEDWFDDLCVRFIINLPREELNDISRICFQIEEAQWFYDDFIRPLDPSLPNLPLKPFCFRIFQHCPLFLEWTPEVIEAAFKEFIEYKQRVPVRGAIMLNDAMDQVVLVKGWKKSANWSFPRGKINKDENDLDCAVREVYEETGFDLRSAGLVKPERETKAIELTMREQHLKMFVFRGVPMDTEFQPRTRKEISKIDWYRLTDLPTGRKKHHQQDGTRDEHVANVNKFYMVAGFIHPLKKWINQQLKKDIKHGSSLAAPPILREESATELEPDWTAMPGPVHRALSPSFPSSLPEVSVQDHHFQAQQDPSTHLKQLLKIGADSVSSPSVSTTNKSNALLDLLRNAPGANGSNTSASHLSGPESFLTSLGPVKPEDVHGSSLQHPKPQIETSPHPNEQQAQDLLQMLNRGVQSAGSRPAVESASVYQHAADLEVPRDMPLTSSTFPVPSANTLPRLTHHTRSLLDAFKSPNPTPALLHYDQLPETSHMSMPVASRATHHPGPSSSKSPVPGPQLSGQRQVLLDAFRSPKVPKSSPLVSGSVPNPSQPPLASVHNRAAPPRYVATPIAELSSSPAATRKVGTGKQTAANRDLLDLFKQTTTNAAATTTTAPAFAGVAHPHTTSPIPVELSAVPQSSPKFPRSSTSSQTDALTALFRKTRESERSAAADRDPVSKAGETGATMETPLNQPQFDDIVKSPAQPTYDVRRSPVSANRTLYNPNQPVPVKILSRQDDTPKPAAKSPRPPKSRVSASPRKAVQTKEKVFQPRILQRPQTADSRSTLTPSPASVPHDVRRSPVISPTLPSPLLDGAPVTSPIASAELPAQPVAMASRKPEGHAQNLLSLFQQPNEDHGAAANMIPAPGRKASIPTHVNSPVSQSHAVSPVAVTDEPISTRSRLSSLASINHDMPTPSTSGGISQPPSVQPASTVSGTIPAHGRPRPEKRQTTADDKAFLLGYLGRIANQEG